MPEFQKRKAERIFIELPVRYWLIKNNKNTISQNTSETLRGISKDISDNGICIKADSFPFASSIKEEKDSFGMEIDLFPHFKNIKAYGKPKWWNEIQGNDKEKFFIGIEFIESKEGNYKILQKYLSNIFPKK